jgi:transcriptional regulator with XRE-family HTH domain
MQNQEYITPVDQYVIDFVRKLRNDKELTQQDIGNIVGVSREYIKDVESINKRAKYNFRHINALADYFDMSPKDFLPEKPLALFFKGREQRGLTKKKSGNKVAKSVSKKKALKK